MTRLSLSLLGPFQATLDGKPVTGFDSNKARALLAYLAVEADHLHPRDVLAGLLWPELPQRTALNNVRYTLSKLRKILADRNSETPFLLVSSDALQFNAASSYQLDVREFQEAVESDRVEQWINAVARYRGPFLEGFALADSSPFEHWIGLKREQLGRLMLKALRGLAYHFEQRGEYEQAQLYAWKQVEAEPWQEEGYQQLMRCLALGGQRTAALGQYEKCRRVLAEELGVEPSDETLTLYESIRDGTLTAHPIAPPCPPFLNPQARGIDVEPPLFVARTAELGRLEGFLNRVLSGQGQVVFVTGEAGSGKTMLLQEFSRRALTAHAGLIAVNGNCNAYTGIGDPYLPFLEALGMITGDIEDKWAAGAISREHARRLWGILPDAVRAVVDDGPELVDRFVLGAALLARAQVGARLQAARLDELVQRKAASSGASSAQQIDLFEQYTKVLCTLARAHPLVLIVDDLQWADTGSLSLLFHLGRRLKGQRILIVGAYRPDDVAVGRDGERHPLEPVVNEFQRDFGENQIDLGHAEGRDLIDALLDSEPNCLDRRFRETLYHHTGGQPLFTVEMLHGLQERGDLTKDDHGRWREGPALDWETLPARVEAVIAESVSRLPLELQALLSDASVEGEFFTAQVVARVRTRDEEETIRALSGPLSKQYRLVSAAGFQRSDGQPISRYRFRHFLFQKYLYSRLDAIERARLHEAAGRALETLYGQAFSELAAPLARHFELAGLTALAVKYLQQAGDRAGRLFANAEAIALYRHALRLLNTLPETPERAGQELKLCIALRVPLEMVYSYTSDQVAENNTRARELIRHAEISPELFWVLVGIAHYASMKLSLDESRTLGDELVALAERLEDTGLMIVACQDRSITALYEGQLETYFRYRQQAHALYNPNEHRTFAFQFDVDPEVAGLVHAAWAYWMRGYPDQARHQAQAALAWAEEVGHPFSVAFAHLFTGRLYYMIRDIATTNRFAEATMEVARKHGMAFWLNAGEVLAAWVMIHAGEIEKGVALQESSFLDTSKMGFEFGRILEIPHLAEAYVCVGRVTEGLALLDEGLQIVKATGYRMIEPDLYRWKGDLLLANGNAEAEAEACYWESIESARHSEAKSWELRAILKLCRLWRRQGKIDSARDLLSSIYGWFTEGFDTPDLQEAHSLLQALAEPSSDD